MDSQTPSGGEPSSPKREIKHVETVEAYNQWAPVRTYLEPIWKKYKEYANGLILQFYDKDGNFLQGLDSMEMIDLFPQFLSLVNPVLTSEEMKVIQPPKKYVDLGCGTGRNTVSFAVRVASRTKIVGLDPSSKMLDLARQRIINAQPQLAGSNIQVTLESYDILKSPAIPACAKDADGLMSTLVLEHVPLKEFFKSVLAILKPGGTLVLTNMHSEMGNISQAGFTDENGVKIRPTSYAHTAAEVVEEASAVGLELVGRMKEVMMNENLARILGPRASKWIGIRVWYGGCFRRIR
ncbi:hypothetical protein FQN57_004064 [Myotisia sp. PD_48]|nr:hypothetical protein FQN57_004064 [Myotisia sp. PD_48]